MLGEDDFLNCCHTVAIVAFSHFLNIEFINKTQFQNNHKITTVEVSLNNQLKNLVFKTMVNSKNH